MKNEVLLFSGGIDSYVAYWYLNKPATVYFDLKSRYSDREIQVVQKLIPETIIDTSIDLGDREIGEKAYIPFRNLLLACLANKYADTIYIVGIEDDNVSDKNEEVFKKFSKLLSELEGREIQVLSPFWEYTKAEIIDWYLKENLSIDSLYQTISCYSATDTTNYCGECPSCFRKYVAFKLNNLPLEFDNVELVSDYLQKAKDGYYTEKRNRNIIKVVEGVW